MDNDLKNFNRGVKIEEMCQQILKERKSEIITRLAESDQEFENTPVLEFDIDKIFEARDSTIALLKTVISNQIVAETKTNGFVH